MDMYLLMKVVLNLWFEFLKVLLCPLYLVLNEFLGALMSKSRNIANRTNANVGSAETCLHRKQRKSVLACVYCHDSMYYTLVLR